jgi:folate-binding protein YgfZ
MSLETELTAILIAAAIAPITDRGFLRITGPDATRWLNGMVTNNIKDLAPGEGNYNFLLNAQGRIQGDCTIYREYLEPESGDPRYLLQTDGSQIEAIKQLLEKFIIMDDVELSKSLEIYRRIVPSDTLSGFIVIGEKANNMFTDVMSGFGYEFLLANAPEPGSLTWGTHEARIILAPPNQPNTFEIWSASIPDIDALNSEFSKLGATLISPAALEAHRILSGTPRYGTDIRNTDTARDLPQETAQTHALNFNKGCYLGQEIVERIHSRGQVHRTFSRFELTGDLPTLPCQLTLDGKPVGELTSAALIPLASGPTLRALGYIRREAATATLAYPNGTAKVLST